ncbi:TPA: hypothetical protein ACH3X2_001198 [Trebouxia sp. C0005]
MTAKRTSSVQRLSPPAVSLLLHQNQNVDLADLQVVDCVASVAAIVGTASARKRNAGFLDIVAAGGDTDGLHMKIPPQPNLHKTWSSASRSAMPRISGGAVNTKDMKDALWAPANAQRTGKTKLYQYTALWP